MPSMWKLKPTLITVVESIWQRLDLRINYSKEPENINVTIIVCKRKAIFLIHNKRFYDKLNSV